MTEVFCLTDHDGRLLNPSVQATILAKYSRSPLSAREILDQLTVEESDKFQEKWVINYGHTSVSELSTIPVCFEGISIIASKFIEKWQRPGYSEKSTRYQKFSKDSFITPPNASVSMKQFTASLYETYDKLYPRMVNICAQLMNKDPADRTVKARAFDNIRYLLPAGTGTNVSCVLNLRDARDMIKALTGHTNPEFREIGNQLTSAASEIAPSLIKHIEPDTFQLELKSISSAGPQGRGQGVELIAHVENSEDIDTAVFKATIVDFYHMSWTQFKDYMSRRPDHTEVPDIFKTITVSFDIVMDYGAFRDLQRHRRCEQYVEKLTTEYGYVIPDDIRNSEIETEYCEAMNRVASYADESVIYDSDLIQYMIPLGYLHRSRFQMDLRELYYIIELRTKPQGHISYRRIAYEMFELAKTKWPELMQWCKAVKPDEIGVHT